MHTVKSTLRKGKIGSTNKVKEIEVVAVRVSLQSSLLLNSFRELFFHYLNNQGINLTQRKASNNCGHASTD
jgi:hypothetical protein